MKAIGRGCWRHGKGANPSGTFQRPTKALAEFMQCLLPTTSRAHEGVGELFWDWPSCLNASYLTSHVNPRSLLAPGIEGGLRQKTK
eukprot:2265297-Amphidinium_carterae.1